MSDKESKRVAEQLNGRLAMLGIVACIGAYLTTGQIIPELRIDVRVICNTRNITLHGNPMVFLPHRNSCLL